MSPSQLSHHSSRGRSLSEEHVPAAVGTTEVIHTSAPCAHLEGSGMLGRLVAPNSQVGSWVPPLPPELTQGTEGTLLLPLCSARACCCTPKAQCSGFDGLLIHQSVQIWSLSSLHGNFCLTWIVLLGDKFLACKAVWIAGTYELSQHPPGQFRGKKRRNRAN